MEARGSRRDLLAGGVFVGFGLAFGLTARTYEVGSLGRMGPGFFPLALGGLLVLLGVLIGVQSLAAQRDERSAPVPWRAVVLLVGALLFFGFTVDGLGLVVSVFVTVLVASMAGRDARVGPAALLALSLTAVCAVVFVYLLQLRLPLVGPWLGG